ncbi:MAG: hypothetical protein PHE88_08270 [Elusimicrobia bacterium]|nr:hypothetical protein [Elusimicrobiota bacterium]
MDIIREIKMEALIVGGIILGVLCLIFGIAWLLKYIWNVTLPEIFNTKRISFWQAFRLMLIIAILAHPYFIKEVHNNPQKTLEIFGYKYNFAPSINKLANKITNKIIKKP